MKIGRIERWWRARVARKKLLRQYAQELNTMAYEFDNKGKIPNNLSGYLVGLADFLTSLAVRRRWRTR